jgi:hypothetical protein
LVVQRQAFVEQLAGHSDSGRLHDQEAVLSDRMKGPEALLTLPEFIRESVPPDAVKLDPRAVLTLPEFIKEPMPSDIGLPKSVMTKKSLKRLRSRSLSTPTLDWILPSGRRTPPDRKAHKRSKSPPQLSSDCGTTPDSIHPQHFSLLTKQVRSS